MFIAIFKKYRPLFILVCAALILIPVHWGIMNVVEEKSMPGLTSVYIKRRVGKALGYLNQYAGKNDTILMGLSDVEIGVDPLDLERDLGSKGDAVYNLGLRGASPEILLKTTERLAEIYNRKQESLAAYILFFPLPAVTERGYARSQRRGHQEVINSLSAFSDIKDEFMNQPLKAYNEIFKKFVLGSYETSTISYYLSEVVFRADTPDPARTYLRFFLDPIFYAGAWSEDFKGQNRLNRNHESDEFNRAVFEINSPQILNAGMLLMESNFGLISAKLSEEGLAQIERALLSAKHFSKKVFLVNIGDRISLSKIRPEQKESELLDVQLRLARKTGVEYLNLAPEGAFTNSDYFDLVHFNDEGQRKLSKALSEKLKGHGL